MSLLTAHSVVAVTNYEQALTFLNAEHDTPDEWIPSLVTAKVCFCYLLTHSLFISLRQKIIHLLSSISKALPNQLLRA
jgi:hypothetical protein